MNPLQDVAYSLHTVRCSADNEARGEALFAPELPIFSGHFPDNPLLPGVHQLALVAELMRRAQGLTALTIVAIERCKWTAPLGPNMALQVHARWHVQGSRWRVDGEVRHGEQRACQCRLVVENSPCPPAAEP